MRPLKPRQESKAISETTTNNGLGNHGSGDRRQVLHGTQDAYCLGYLNAQSDTLGISMLQEGTLGPDSAKCVPLRDGVLGMDKVAVKQDGGGLRYDEGKTRVDLIPADALLEVGKVYLMGSSKYAERNWERGMKYSKVLGPMLRHLYKWMMGADRDEESKELHLSHVAFGALALLAYELRGIGKMNDGKLDDVRGHLEQK